MLSGRRLGEPGSALACLACLPSFAVMPAGQPHDLRAPSHDHLKAPVLTPNLPAPCAETVPIRPFKHNEYERFIVQVGGAQFGRAGCAACWSALGRHWNAVQHVPSCVMQLNLKHVQF